MEVLFLILLFILGACMGSFLCCQARRLRYRSTLATKTKAKVKTTKIKTKAKAAKTKTAKAPLKTHRPNSSARSKPHGLGPRSVCLSCKHQLKWYDNLPIISWLVLRGKCRNCGKPIGALEILSELGVACGFLLLSTTVNLSTIDALGCVSFIITLLLTLVLSFLAIYDGAYGELPTKCLLISILLAFAAVVVEQLTILIIFPFTPEIILAPLASVAILGGLYLTLYLVSHGKWVGDGDWLLGTAIGLALASPWLSLIALCLANFLACLVMLPLVKKIKRRKIHFGPFMVAAFVITYSFSNVFLAMLA